MFGHLLGQMKAARDITEEADCALEAKEENSNECFKEFSIRLSVGFFGQTSLSTGTQEEDREATAESTAGIFNRDICLSGRVYRQSASPAPVPRVRDCHS